MLRIVATVIKQLFWLWLSCWGLFLVRIKQTFFCKNEFLASAHFRKEFVPVVEGLATFC